MTGDIFKEWRIWFDSKMKGRKVALLMNNLSAHEAVYYGDIQLRILLSSRFLLIHLLDINLLVKGLPVHGSILETAVDSLYDG
jgi:hypothetical protein